MKLLGLPKNIILVVLGGLTKTNRKPYDAVVATILVGIKKIAPKKFEPRADGSLRVGGVNKWSKK